jgi:hypothetical protein
MFGRLKDWRRIAMRYPSQPRPGPRRWSKKLMQAEESSFAFTP